MQSYRLIWFRYLLKSQASHGCALQPLEIVTIRTADSAATSVARVVACVWCVHANSPHLISSHLISFIASGLIAGPREVSCRGEWVQPRESDKGNTFMAPTLGLLKEDAAAHTVSQASEAVCDVHHERESRTGGPSDGLGAASGTLAFRWCGLLLLSFC